MRGAGRQETDQTPRVRPGPGERTASGPGSVLGGVVDGVGVASVMVVVVMAPSGSEGRAGKHHQKQGSGK